MHDPATLVGTALGSAALAVHAVVTRDEGWELRLTGAALYLVAFGITVGYHIPRNNALDTVDVGSATAAQFWADYYEGWVRWNHARSAAAIAGSIAYITSLLR
jgi:uncharacterized membrane protein